MRKRAMSAAVAALGTVASIAVAGGPVWVSNDGQAHVVARSAHAILLEEEEGGERFDLADLRDGETRVFGQGAKQLTARRTGDEVVLERVAQGDQEALRVSCRLPSDHCSVVTFADEPEKVMLVVEKMRTCVGDDAECSADIDVDLMSSGIGSSAHRVIVENVECKGDDCTAVESGPAVVRIRHSADSDTVALRCPEGDTTMRVARDDADATYLCPKHSVPLERR